MAITRDIGIHYIYMHLPLLSFVNLIKDNILTCFQLLSSQYPKPFVRITNKLIFIERLIDSTTIYPVYRLCTFDFSHTHGFLG